MWMTVCHTLGFVDLYPALPRLFQKAGAIARERMADRFLLADDARCKRRVFHLDRNFAIVAHQRWLAPVAALKGNECRARRPDVNPRRVPTRIQPPQPGGTTVCG